MNKLIKNELNKVSVANVSGYDENKSELFIPRFKQVRLEENSYYLIKLDDALLNPNEMSTLSSNWNRGTVPPQKYMKIDISKILGKMIQVTGIGYDLENDKDLNIMWSGWLPITGIEVIKKL